MCIRDRAKPLIQLPEEATKRYAGLVRLPVVDEPCPHFHPEAHRLKEVFDHLERLAPMGKLQFYHTMRTVMRPERDDESGECPCEVCGAQTRMRVCPICRLKEAQQETLGPQASGLHDGTLGEGSTAR